MPALGADKETATVSSGSERMSPYTVTPMLFATMPALNVSTPDAALKSANAATWFVRPGDAVPGATDHATVTSVVAGTSSVTGILTLRDPLCPSTNVASPTD